MAANKKVALIVGVANHRSIAWACAQSFLEADFDCIVTYQSERFQSQISKLAPSRPLLAALPCNVQHEIPQLFDRIVTDVLQPHGRTIDAIVHSVAYADFERQPLRKASWTAFAQAQHISAYSLLELAREAQPHMSPENSSITALSYLGAVRAVPNYHIMGPAKASLEALVRGLAIEYGGGSGGLSEQRRTGLTGTSTDSVPPHSQNQVIRINAVSAAPINTMAAKGIPGFSTLYEQAAAHSPLGRHVTAQEVGNTVRFLATDGSGITGQTIYVDGGFSSVVGMGGG